MKTNPLLLWALAAITLHAAVFALDGLQLRYIVIFTTDTDAGLEIEKAEVRHVAAL